MTIFCINSCQEFKFRTHSTYKYDPQTTAVNLKNCRRDFFINNNYCLQNTKMIPEVVPGSPDVHTKRLGKVNSSSQPLISQEGLILPRKPINPCLESVDRQNLHRELMFNQKIGKNVLNQKSELQRALEKHKDAQLRRETEKQNIETIPELERVIADRAKKLMEPQITEEEDDKSLSKEILMARAKLRTRTESK